MAKRNMKAIAERAKKTIPEQYDIALIDLQTLRELSETDLYEAFITAFYFGVGQGIKAEKKKTTRANAKD